ncbi:Uncharacterised protein [Mycobacterium tuberculosis]|nr:Uncharacterised protein [Mycobacterium tuberculosis]
MLVYGEQFQTDYPGQDEKKTENSQRTAILAQHCDPVNGRT